MNQTLSQNRANAVRDYLIKKGVAYDRFDTKGYGDTRPIQSNKTAAGRAANRRIEFIVSSQ
jgi:outer membrane protein OmpA-like peptidoglycan-associated protein